MSRCPPVLMYNVAARVSEDPNDVRVSSEKFKAQDTPPRTPRGLRRERFTLEHVERYRVRIVCVKIQQAVCQGSYDSLTLSKDGLYVPTL